MSDCNHCDVRITKLEVYNEQIQQRFIEHIEREEKTTQHFTKRLDEVGNDMKDVMNKCHNAELQSAAAVEKVSSIPNTIKIVGSILGLLMLVTNVIILITKFI